MFYTNKSHCKFFSVSRDAPFRIEFVVIIITTKRNPILYIQKLYKIIFL